MAGTRLRSACATCYSVDMTERPLTERQREALLLLLRSPSGVDRANRVQQGVWNSLRKRGLTIYRRPFDRLTDAGRTVAESLED